jgi:hypothetical protein
MSEASLTSVINERLKDKAFSLKSSKTQGEGRRNFGKKRGPGPRRGKTLTDGYGTIVKQGAEKTRGGKKRAEKKGKKTGGKTGDEKKGRAKKTAWR